MHRGTLARHVLLVACVLAASSAAAQRGPVSDPLVKENATVKLAEHSYVIPDFNVGLVPNVGIIVGSRATLVIDPGLGRRNGETVLREVAKVSRNANIFIASTHFHPEHTTGYVAFPATAKYVNSTVQEAEFAQGGAQLIQTFSGRSPMTAELLKDATRRKADITFDHDYVLDLGGVRVRFLVVGPTHTRGDTGFFVEGDRVLFAGDVVMHDSFLAAGQVSSMKAWLAAFDAFDAMRPKTIVPAHGVVGDGSIIATNRAIMQDVQARARQLKAQGRSADDTATTVQMEFQAKHPDWPRGDGLAAAARAAYAEAPASASQSPPVRSAQQVLVALERDWNEAFYRKDIAFIRNVLADEFIATYDDGSRGDKAKELALAAEFNQQVESAIQDEFTVTVYRDTAVVWFTLHVVGIKQGQQAELTLRYTDVWVMRDGQWQCVSSQSTRVNPK